MTVAPTGLDPLSIDVFPGSVLRIIGGASNGYHKITAVYENYVLTDTGTAQAHGKVEFLELDFDLVTACAEVARQQAEAYTGQSFSGRKSFTEYRMGNGGMSLVLQRRQIQTIESMSIYSLPPTYGHMLGITPEDIDLEHAKETGILNITPEAASGALLLQINYLTNKFFPNAKIQVKGTYGWDADDETGNGDEVPENARKAIEYLTMAGILADEMSRAGNPTSFSQEGFSQSMDIGRDISAYQDIARGLLAAYQSGEVGS